VNSVNVTATYRTSCRFCKRTQNLTTPGENHDYKTDTNHERIDDTSELSKKESKPLLARFPRDL